MRGLGDSGHSARVDFAGAESLDRRGKGVAAPPLRSRRDAKGEVLHPPGCGVGGCAGRLRIGVNGSVKHFSFLFGEIS